MDMALLYPSTTTQSSSFLTVHYLHPILTVKPIVTLTQSRTTKYTRTRFTTITAATPGGAQGGMKEQTWTHEGLITESLSNGMFKVGLENGDVILGHVSGKIRQSHIRILPGDRVQIEVSRYDSSRGRITYRLRTDRAKGTS